MDTKGNDALLTTTRVTEWTINQGGYISLLFGGFLLLGCVTAYVLAVARGNVDPFLPLISDAAGSPPQNGLFGTFICVGGMFGVAFMILRYMIVEDKNRDQSSLVSALNRLSLFAGIISMLGITLITGYPINFYRNKEVWLLDVGLPHMIGGVMLFALGIVYIGTQCVLTLFLKSKNQMTLLLRVALCLVCTAAFVYHMITVPEHFGGHSKLYYSNATYESFNNTDLSPYPPTLGASLKLPIDTSGSYVSSAITEWILVFFYCCFFFTFFKEAQQYSLLIVVETHTKQETKHADEFTPDLAKVPPLNGNQVDTKPAPEAKKFYRRDSTCQTMTDDLEEVIVKVPNKDTSVKNGIKKPPLIPVLDVKIKKLTGESNGKPKLEEETPQTTENNVSTSCDELDVAQEENETSKSEELSEETAIEKIDAVVKDAEETCNLNGTSGIEKESKSEESEDMKKSDSDIMLPSPCPFSLQ